MKSVSDRFWSRVLMIPFHECWEWGGSIYKTGYGQFSIKHLPVLAHRVSWTLTNGEIKNGLHVLHKCDNRSCVNPSHLFLGTQFDNMRDMVNKKRNKVNAKPQPGEKHGMSKLTEIEVMKIRNDTRIKREIAKEYGVSVRLIYKIKSKELWSHLN